MEALRACRRSTVPVALAVALATSCGTGELAAPEVSPPAADNCFVPERTPGLARLAPWLGGHRFLLPVELATYRRSGAKYVAQMYGQIFRVDENTSEVQLIADLAGRGINEGGLRELAFHPTEPRAFVVVECPPLVSDPLHPPLGFDSQLRSYDVRPDGTLDLDSETLVLRVNVPGGAHSMDTLRFGPDGALYVSIGDGRMSEASRRPEYDPTTLLGTILRIDVDGGAPYAIPPDNPFVSDPKMRHEVFAYGFRNPWKFSFDRVTGELWAGDVGETRTEEINRVVAGGNYGWPQLEGTDCQRNVPDCDAAGTILPTFSYTHATGNAITGGFVYRGARNPLLVGKYVYADFQAGGLWALDLDTPGARPIHLNTGEVRPFSAALAEGEDGEIFALDWFGGGIYTLEPDTATPERPPFPERLSDTGCFVGADPRRPASRLISYDVNVELWSDGAAKSRFVALPTGTTLEERPDGTLALPPGGLTIKTFFQDAAKTKPIETRFFGRQGNGEWVAASYEWNAAGTDAVLLKEAKELSLPSGQRWTVPAPAQCFFCHQERVGMSLGLDRRQLDRVSSDGLTTENNLARFNRLGVLRAATPVAPLAPLDSDAPLEVRARSYFHVNCSMCHYQGNASIFSVLNLRMETPFEQTGLCNFIQPGSPGDSRIVARMRTRGLWQGLDIRQTQMPPVATNAPDATGLALISEWIRTTTRCSPP